MKKILIIKLWALGDIVMATPMLNAIRAKDPDAHITWLVDSSHAAVLENHPLIDEVMPVDTGRWRLRLRRGDILGWIAQALTLNAALRGRRFDAAINCHPDKFWTNWLCAAPVRVALFHWGAARSGRWFYRHVVQAPGDSVVHITDQYLKATTAIGYPPAGKQMSLGETEEEVPFAREFLRRHDMAGDVPLAILAPFTSAENKSLSAEASVEIAQWLAAKMRYNVIVTCGPGDVERANGIATTVGDARVAVAGGTTVRQYIALLRRSDLVVTADSSALHIAAAIGKPYVALFGPTNPAHFAPREATGLVIAKDISCSPCGKSTCSHRVFQECLRIDLSEVQRAVGSLCEGKVLERSHA